MADKIAQLLTALAVLCLAAVVFLGGLGFLSAAAYSALAETLQPAAAAAIVGAGCLVLAILLLQVARAVTRPKARPAPAASDSAAPAGAPKGTAGAEFEEAARLGAAVAPLIKRNWKTATLGAFATGLVLGVSPRARRALSDLIRKQL